jgi:hypothetical protein
MRPGASWAVRRRMRRLRSVVFMVVVFLFMNARAASGGGSVGI